MDARSVEYKSASLNLKFDNGRDPSSSNIPKAVNIPWRVERDLYRQGYFLWKVMKAAAPYILDISTPLNNNEGLSLGHCQSSL